MKADTRCAVCQQPITEEDIATGRVTAMGDTAFCSMCSKEKIERCKDCGHLILARDNFCKWCGWNQILTPGGVRSNISNKAESPAPFLVTPIKGGGDRVKPDSVSARIQKALIKPPATPAEEAAMQKRRYSPFRWGVGIGLGILVALSAACMVLGSIVIPGLLGSHKDSWSYIIQQYTPVLVNTTPANRRDGKAIRLEAIKCIAGKPGYFKLRIRCTNESGRAIEWISGRFHIYNSQSRLDGIKNMVMFMYRPGGTLPGEERIEEVWFSVSGGSPGQIAYEIDEVHFTR